MDYFRFARYPPGVAKRHSESAIDPIIEGNKFFQRQMNIDRLNFLSLPKELSISSRTDFDLLAEMVS